MSAYFSIYCSTDLFILHQNHHVFITVLLEYVAEFS